MQQAWSSIRAATYKLMEPHMEATESRAKHYDAVFRILGCLPNWDNKCSYKANVLSKSSWTFITRATKSFTESKLA